MADEDLSQGTLPYMHIPGRQRRKRPKSDQRYFAGAVADLGAADAEWRRLGDGEAEEIVDGGRRTVGRDA